MDPGASTRRRSDVSFLERKFRSLTLRRDASDSPVDVIGDLGLNLLYEPNECLIDFIFVHGLRGGSRKTWSASPSPAHYWPKEWLPADSDFKHVRIHSFGYNSDWLERRENLLNIHDFGQSLIEEIQASPSIRRDQNTRIVFIGHSMGGLVIKKACILSRENPSFHDLGDRIHSIYFLATPHRGSDLAQTLNNMVKAIPGSGSKPFVGSLERGSETINTLNDQFRHVCKRIAIHSFIESVPMKFVTGSAMVVDKHSATLGYPDERVQVLNADHRRICKFDSPDDTNFRTLRNRLASTVDDIERNVPRSRHQKYREEMQTLSKYLNISGSPIDDLSSLEDARIMGSCEWVTNRKSFLDWQFNETSARYFWLTGQPATGKSVITAHVIGCMAEYSCSYFFFKHGDQNRSSLSGLLLSIAYQMAQQCQAIRQTLLEVSQDDWNLDKSDYRGIWRRLFVGGIFRISFTSTQYWVIDALDECVAAEKRGFDHFFSMLAKIDISIPLKIFVSSRASVDIERLFTPLSFVNVQISVEDSTQDIRTFVETYAEDLPAENETSREELVETIVRKSAGCFLWTVLVMRQLQDIYTSEEIEEILREVPEEMDALYNRNLQILESRPRTKRLARAVLTWTLCATRPLTVEELKNAIRLDLKTMVARDLEKSVSTLCCQFVFVDKHNRVHIVHETARTFLLDSNLQSEFQVQMSRGNVQLGLACLEYLTSEEMAASRKRRSSSNLLRETNKSALASYACSSFSEHLVRSASSSDPLFLALRKFLQTNILVWIERMAEDADLGSLIRTATHLKAYQARRAKHVAPLQDEVSSWATDLPRIATEFGSNLLRHPAAIHDLIPPLCPRSSSVYRQFGTSKTGIQLQGLFHNDWKDQISCWHYGKTARSLACQDQWFAIGLSDGTINIHWTSTCQQAMQMSHGESVRVIRFGNLAKIMVSTGLRWIKLWDVHTGSKLWEHKLTSDPLAVDFDDDDARLVVSTRSKEILSFSIADGSIISHDNWHHNLPHDFRHIISKAPSMVAISTSHKAMAIVYRGMPLCLWDLQFQQIGFCTKSHADGRDASNDIITVCFNPVQVLNMLAVSYLDGDVAIFDTVSREMVSNAKLDTQHLAVSPDGRTLAGGDSDGNITLFDFETLQLLYRVAPSTDGVTALAFTGDSLRLMDLRGAQVNVWEPAALVRKWDYANDDRSEFSSEATAPVTEGSGTSPIDQFGDITDIKSAYAGSLAICARNNGSIDTWDLTSTEPVFKELYKHKGGFISILSLDWNESHHIIASVDTSGRFKARRLSKDAGNIKAVEQLLDAQISFNYQVNQLVISPDGTKLLVSSPASDMLWSLETGDLTASQELEPRTYWRWFVDPQDETQVVLLEGSSLRIFAWESLGSFIAIGESDITMGALHPLHLGNTVVDVSGKAIVTKLSPKVGRGNSSPLLSAKETSIYKIQLPDSLSLKDSLLAEPFFSSEDAKKQLSVKHLLGTTRGVFGSSLLVFIAESGWVCTAELNEPLPQVSFRRHFFLPPAWLSTNEKIISVITDNQDILFAYGQEVAIIKNGLKTVEVISIS